MYGCDRRRCVARPVVLLQYGRQVFRNFYRWPLAIVASRVMFHARQSVSAMLPRSIAPITYGHNFRVLPAVSNAVGMPALTAFEASFRPAVHATCTLR